MHTMHYVFLRFPGGLPKAVTLSYDDGAHTDVRLIETIDKYGLKCTLNITGDGADREKGLSTEYLKTNVLGHGHEIANHGYMHRALDSVRPIEGIRDTLDCRLKLEELFGGIIRGMAYADRSVDPIKKPNTYREVTDYLSKLDIAYARMAGSSKDFELPEDWLGWMPTAHHDDPEIFNLIDRFVNLDLDQMYCSTRSPKVFYLWGHSFEFEGKNNWDHLETICQKLTGREDCWYAANIDLCLYAKAFKNLVYSADGRRVYNPTLYTLWFDVDGKLYTIAPGETIEL